jgi:hypothetical protein
MSIQNISFDDKIIDPHWKAGRKQWNTLTAVKGLHLYGSSMPPVIEDESSYVGCFKTFTFYMYIVGIKKLVSLQACRDKRGQPSGCGEDEDMEKSSWLASKLLVKTEREDDNITYDDIYIKDMMCGSINAWYKFATADYTLKNNCTLIHCYAGYGRTGWFLLTGILKHYLSSEMPCPKGRSSIHTLAHTWFNLPSAQALIDMLKLLMTSSVELYSTTITPIQEKINMFDINDMIEEVFNISNVYHQHLFIQRFNLMITSVAASHIYTTPIIIYKLSPNPSINENTYEALLSRPHTGTIVQLSDSLTNNKTFVKNEYGIERDPV